MISDQNINHIIRMEDVSRKVALKPSSIYGLIQAGKFPKPFKIAPGGRASGWLSSDIELWLLSRATGDSNISIGGEDSITQSEGGIYVCE